MLMTIEMLIEYNLQLEQINMFFEHIAEGKKAKVEIV